MKIQEFYKELIQDIKTQQVSEDDGAKQEQIFTEYVIDLLTDSGETENARTAFSLKEDSLGRPMHKINGYSLSENYETLDLFITNFKGLDQIRVLTKQEAESAGKQAERFFKNAIFKEYINELDESSEVFDLAHTLADVPEVKEFLTRINIYILTDGIFKSDIQYTRDINNYPLYIRVIDLEYLFNLSDDTRVPIEINFKQYGSILPCLKCPVENEEYETFLVLLPGMTLALIYEEYGARLLEQNVRSFLQFTGKINKGIRKTIKEEPVMFLAFNNGIAVTAEEIEVVDCDHGGKAIKWAKDFQIVNGGQTTASIYHTWKKDKADISDIYIQTKLTLIKNRENLNDIVNRIAECANTQNKVSTSDLSSNNPFHIAFEKLSRAIWTTPVKGNNQQTRWFYERARGQYRNTRNKEGYTQARKKAFELKNPRNQMITKVNLAKYINSCVEIYKGKKTVVAPNIVVRGSQKNYLAFLLYNMSKNPGKKFFEISIAKAILFSTAEKIYGRKPNSIGEMRYITVPYSIGWLNYQTKHRIDFIGIWQKQSISDSMKSLLYSLMALIDTYIIDKAPGALYGEWAKKEECWLRIRSEKFLNLDTISEDLLEFAVSEDTDEELEKLIEEERLRQLKIYSHSIWSEFHLFFETRGEEYKSRTCFNIARKLRTFSLLTDFEVQSGLNILSHIHENEPQLLPKETDKSTEDEKDKTISSTSINSSILKKMIDWEQNAHILSDIKRNKLYYISTELEVIDYHHRIFLLECLSKMKEHGFTPF